jgi:FkbM family methyltransferase
MKLLKNFLRRAGYDVQRYTSLGSWLALHDVDLVLDIGANDGRYVSEVREAGWKGNITSVEPQPKAFQRLKEKYAHDTRWQGFQMGLGNENTTLPLNAHAYDVLSSFLKPNENVSNEIKIIQVPVKRLEDCWDDLCSNAQRVFVKMDTQGFELEILKGMHNKLPLIVGFQLELSIEPLYHQQPKMHETIGILDDLGYRLWKTETGLKDQKNSRVFEMDGIFF